MAGNSDRGSDTSPFKLVDSDTLKRAFNEFQEDQGMVWAAALTFFAVLALFPAIAALLAVVGLVMNPQTLTDNLTAIVSQFGPQSAVQTLQGPINSIASSGSSNVIYLLIGLVGSLWTASGYVGAFSKASNAVWEVEEGREIYKLKPLQMLITLVCVVLVAVVLVALVVTGPVAAGIGEAIGLGSTFLTIYGWLKWPIMAALVLAILAVLYYSTPNARLPKFSFVTPGSLAALITWVVASALFAVYVANFGSYNETYGTLGGVVVLLLWLWITNIAILFGQELNSEIERARQLRSEDPAMRRRAERSIQVPEREEPDKGQIPDTASGSRQPPAEDGEDGSRAASRRAGDG